jgi:hypothetical protein
LNTSEDALITFSADTLRFDTVFTTTGSVTKSFKIFNRNEDRVRISSIRISGGGNSFFTMNADGTPGQDIRDLEIAGNDSLYVFAAVSIDPSNNQLPFLVQDSIFVEYNGVRKQVQLEAYGQNAVFLRNQTIARDTEWTNVLPYVILGGLRVDTAATLTIREGTRIYCHADAPLVVDGTLVATGTRSDSIVFRSDRIDPIYRDLPAGWPGIYFRASSRNSSLTYAYIKNAYQGIVADQPSVNANPKLVLTNCVIDNSYETGIAALHSSLTASNCLVSNCGINILLVRGGNYNFTHCTVAAYSTTYLLHKNPVLIVNNWDSSDNGLVTFDLKATFTNSIFWGDYGAVDNEVVVSKKGNNPFDVSFIHNLYKAESEPPNSNLTENIRNQDPLFDSVNTAIRFFDFHLQTKPSPAINKGISTSVLTDLDSKPRDTRPDLGCYERY